MFLLSSSRSVISRLRVGKMASNILKSFPNLGMRSRRQEGAWWGDQFTSYCWLSGGSNAFMLSFILTTG